MKVIIIAAVLASSAIAQAGDSSWLVCKGRAEHGATKQRDWILISAVEHRGTDGDSRNLTLTLLKGVNAATGDLNDKKHPFVDKAASLTMKTAKGRVVMTGTVTLSNDFKTLSLGGKLDTAYGAGAKATLEAFDAKLACEQLDDLAND
jgi:hypothetical protein